ncbi:MAG: glycosyltransferase 87 family protein [Abditibacteriales bacterium]|nr:glycosyltransferase 87 family protein [Abditibacteriales bacterium]MDW8365889.1 glycosyltransferase 87 family protein [Abditibacteriales bacterium]
MRGFHISPSSYALLLLIAVYVAWGILFRFTHPPHGDAGALVRSTRRLLDGSLALYAERGSEWAAPPHGLSTGYPPLYAFLFAPFVAFSDATGRPDEFAERLIGLPMLLFDALAVWAFVRLIKRLFPEVKDLPLLVASALILFASGLVSASWVISHPEGMTICFLLLGLSYLPDRPTLAGFWLGMSLLSKQTALFALMPMGFALWQSAPRAVAYRVFGVAAVTVAVIFAPFILAHPHQAYYAFIVAETRREIGGANLWHFISYATHRTLPLSIYEPLRAVIIRSANGVLLLTALAASVIASRQPLRLHSARLYALIALSNVLLLILGKWVEQHYYALPLTLVVVWDVVRRRGGVPITAAVVLLLIRFGYLLPKPGIHPISSSLLFLTAVGCAVILAKDLRRET